MRAPRFFANSYSSRIRMPEPSPRTNPSRSLSKGRDAVAGSSLRSESALQAQKPPTPDMLMHASAPPAIITSASPYSIMRPASPTQCALVVQAETIDTFGPLALNWIEIMPATMLMIVPGTKNGDRRLGPLAIISRMLSSIIGSPPMPEPTFTPTRSALESSITSPASSSASFVAARPKCTKRSDRRVSFGGIQSAELNPFTSAAKRVVSCDAWNLVMGATPLTPFVRLSQAAAMPIPTGETIPSPVTTTLRFDMVFGAARSRIYTRDAPAMGLLLDVSLDVIDRLLDVGDLLSVLVGDLALELFLECHHELYVIEGIRAQVFRERRVVLHVGLGDSKLLGDDLLDAGFNVVHRLPPGALVSSVCIAQKARNST